MRQPVLVVGFAAAILMGSPYADAQQITEDFELNYSLHDLGSVPGVPSNYGGLTFKYDDPNTLLIGGAANSAGAAIYAIEVVRGCDNLIIGFAGEATLFATAPQIDGGLAYGPGNVLFYATYSNNTIGQIKPGSTAPDKITPLNPLGVTGTTGTLNFVPAGYPGEGRLKIATYSGATWYDTTITPDGDGTFDIQPVEGSIFIGSGPEGIAFVEAGSPNFQNDSVLISEYGGGRVATYELDANGDPIVKTRRVMVTGLSGAEGATVDPLTNDFLFSTFGGGSRILVVRGFELPHDVGDLNADQTVDVSDLLILLSAWGSCSQPGTCPPDFNADCQVDVSDLLILLGNWG